MTHLELPADPRAVPDRSGGLRVVAITDRRLMVPAGLLASGDGPAIAGAFGDAVARAVADCPPGSVAVQVREKDLDGGLMLQLVRAAQRHADRVIVNDRLDVALAAGASGVHLPERGLGLADARKLAPRLALGVSRHAPTLAVPGAAGDAATASRPDRDVLAALLAAAAADGAQLVQLGPVWATPGKPGVRTLGEDALAVPHAGVTLVAVGGIDAPERAMQATAAGADAVAVIRAAWAGGSLAPYVAAADRGRRSTASVT